MSTDDFGGSILIEPKHYNLQQHQMPAIGELFVNESGAALMCLPKKENVCYDLSNSECFYSGKCGADVICHSMLRVDSRNVCYIIQYVNESDLKAALDVVSLIASELKEFVKTTQKGLEFSIYLMENDSKTVGCIDVLVIYQTNGLPELSFAGWVELKSKLMNDFNKDEKPDVSLNILPYQQDQVTEILILDSTLVYKII